MRNIVLTALSLLVSVVAAEWFVRGFVTVRDVGPSFTTYDPYYGKRLKRGFTATRTTPEFQMSFSTNSLGFRGTEPLGTPARPVLFLGDSFTMGYGVSDGSEFPARVDLALRQKFGASAPATVNAGVGDSGNGFWVKFLRHEATRMNPRLVVMEVLENDFVDNIREGLFQLKADGTLDELPVAPQSVARTIQRFFADAPGISSSYLVGLARQVRSPHLSTNGSPSAESAALSPSTSDRLTYLLIQESLALCAANNWQVLGLLVGLSADRQHEALALFTQHRFPVVVLPAKEQRPDLYYSIDGHWNDRGHAHAADQVLRAIDEHAIQLVDSR